mmetsp:Transcript_12345/g.35696  ORF Transcript_12345/g.35696 Transcript_12345/m.35696 type:complete len:121 (-) Transcript_12345:372-734(-)
MTPHGDACLSSPVLSSVYAVSAPASASASSPSDLATQPAPSPSDPKTAREALSGGFGPPHLWRQAMKDELERIMHLFDAFEPVFRLPHAQAGANTLQGSSGCSPKPDAFGFSTSTLRSSL